MSRYLCPLALISTMNLLACSGSSEREVVPIEDFVPPDSGSDHRIPDGGEIPDAMDSDALEDADILIPNDADRSDQGTQCVEDEACNNWIEVGACERAACEKGRCVKATRPNGTACDDGNVCTVGDACKEGQCHGGDYDPGAVGCVQEPKPGSLWFTEIMGNPREVPGHVDPVEGQWFEVGATKPIRLDGLKLVYFEWDGASMPTSPESTATHQLAPGQTDQARYSVFLRSQQLDKNGWGWTKWSYSEIRFSKTKSARLMIVLPAWGGKFPIDESLIVADVEIPAGTFSDANAGRSWQRSASGEDDPLSAEWCHTEVSGINNYDDKSNYASPGQPNADCP